MYGKLFSSMYDGSLAMVGPWEALVTFQQLIILSDQEGFVDMTAEAISRRTIIPLEIIKRGIAELEKPDPHSRDASNDGRRIERISDSRDWGWKIVNYAKYRAIRSAEERRAYMREYMKQKRAAEKPQKEKPAAPDGFDAFWQAYPRKAGKLAARKAWANINGTDPQTIIDAIAKHAQSEQWKRDGGKFIPHPASWLNGRRWEDEVKVAPQHRPGYVPI